MLKKDFNIKIQIILNMTLRNNTADTNEDYCYFERSLELLKKKWTVTILRDMLLGKQYFSEFKKESLSNKVLSQRLKELEENGLVNKNVDENNITSYHLTETGEDLKKIIYELAVFNLNSLDYTDDEKTEIRKKLEILKS